MERPAVTACASACQPHLTLINDPAFTGRTYMIHVPIYAVALRCIAQSLQSCNVDIFQLSTIGEGFVVEYLDPKPPYRNILRREFSAASIEILDREGQAKRRGGKSEFRFDSFPETLRAVGRYVDSKRVSLRRLKDCSIELDQLALEYQTRDGSLQSEILDIRSIREIGISMYKQRSRIANPVTLITRRA